MTVMAKEEDKKNGQAKKKPPVRGVIVQMRFDFQKLLWLGVVALMVLSLFELWSSGSTASHEELLHRQF